MSYQDRLFDFKGQWGAPSRCGLKIVQKKDETIVIASELFEENPGTSVTSFIAGLATVIVKEFGLDPGKTLFIEHCPTADQSSTIIRNPSTWCACAGMGNGSRIPNGCASRKTPRMK